LTHAPDAARRRSFIWAAVATLLLLVGAGALVVGLRGSQDGLNGTAQTPPWLSETPPWLSAFPAGMPRTSSPVVVVHSSPVWLRIPAISVSVPISQLGLNPDGTVQVPTDPAEPGWYGLGPSPGQVGSAVILGHVDSYAGPAVFFRLRSLQAGDQVDVSLADGVTADFVVTAVSMYPKDNFPASGVYGSHGISGLQLVTCGGTFDPATRSYLSNVVAYTTLVGSSGP